VAHQGNGRPVDPGIRVILEELRDLRVEMRADRRRSDERFEQVIRELRDERRTWREESARQAMTTQRTSREVHAVGLAIVRTLNRHTRILERIDRKLGVRGNGRPGNGRSG